MMMGTAAQAVSIYPNRIVIQGEEGTKASLQIKIYGHPEATSVDFVKADNLRELDDKVLQSFELGKEMQYLIPIDIVISETKDYYLCAVLNKSQSMRLRVCSAVRVVALPKKEKIND